MSTSGNNPRIQITVNARTPVVTGLQQAGILNFGLAWKRRDLEGATQDELSALGHTAESWQDGTIRISSGALDATNRQALAWIEDKLTIGDVISIEVLPPGEIDVPIKQKPTLVTQNPLQRKRAHAEALRTKQLGKSEDTKDERAVPARRPEWIQGPEWPDCCGIKMEFVGQIDDKRLCTEEPKYAKMWWHDAASFYVFTCSQCLKCQAIGQQY